MKDESLELIKRAEVLIYNNPMTSRDTGATLKSAIKWLVDARIYLKEKEDKPASGHALQNNIALQDKE